MNTQQQIGERDRDRALLKLRLLTAAGGIASLAVAALGTSAAAQASTPSSPAKASGSGLAKASPKVGTLSAQQLAALNFALPKQGTVVIWKSAGQASTGGRASAPMPATGGGATGGGTVSAPVPAPVSAPAPAPAPAPPAPAPVPPPPPVATSGTS
jgi:hypothetical protein